MNHSAFKYEHVCRRSGRGEEGKIFLALENFCQVAINFPFTHTHMATYFLIIYARLARSNRGSETKNDWFINFGSLSPPPSFVAEISRSCEKNSTCGSYFAMPPPHGESQDYFTKQTCHVRVLGKYYDRTTWNYHPRSDIKATPCIAAVKKWSDHV